MVLFWATATLLVGAAAVLLSVSAAAAAKRAGGRADPLLAVYRRQLDEVDELALRGLIGADDQRATKAEASRRLLSAADRPDASWRSGGRGSRLAVAGCGALAAAAAIALYGLLGAAGSADQPYGARLAAWRKADPARLAPDQMAAVLQAVAAERPGDPKVFDYLGRAQLAAGDLGAATGSFAKAAKLRPDSSDAQAQVGEASMLAAEGKVTAEAEDAFRRALAIDRRHPVARYHLARARIERGDVAGGLQDWRTLASDLPAIDPRRGVLLAQIDRVAAGGSVEPPSAPEPAVQADQASFIRGMVDSLAARLKAQPKDPDGWARLIRSYGVLGDDTAKAAALATARSLFKDDPAALAKIEAQAVAATSPPPTAP